MINTATNRAARIKTTQTTQTIATMPDNPLLKKIDRTKHPPNETWEQVVQRVARDQIEYGVAEGEEDFRPFLIAKEAVR